MPLETRRAQGKLLILQLPWPGYARLVRYVNLLTHQLAQRHRASELSVADGLRFDGEIGDGDDFLRAADTAFRLPLLLLDCSQTNFFLQLLECTFNY